MNDNSNALEGLRLIANWSKWLITLETGAVSIIGTLVIAEHVPISFLANIFATVSIICFFISIAAAAILLLSLPEIAKTLQPEQNIWITRDSIIGRVFRMTTQSLAIIESLFFGLGMVCFCSLMIVLIWIPAGVQ